MGRKSHGGTGGHNEYRQRDEAGLLFADIPTAGKPLAVEPKRPIGMKGRYPMCARSASMCWKGPYRIGNTAAYRRRSGQIGRPSETDLKI